MTHPIDQTEILIHDLRRFLHNAHDQQKTLGRISESMTNTATLMKEQDISVKRTLQSLKQQIEKGIDVNINADLKSHVAEVASAAAPLLKEINSAKRSTHNLTVKIALVAFSSGFCGATLGAILTPILV